MRTRSESESWYNKRIGSEVDRHNLCWNLTEIEYKKMMTGVKLTMTIEKRQQYYTDNGQIVVGWCMADTRKIVHQNG